MSLAAACVRGAIKYLFVADASELVRTIEHSLSGVSALERAPCVCVCEIRQVACGRQRSSYEIIVDRLLLLLRLR